MSSDHGSLIHVDWSKDKSHPPSSMTRLVPCTSFLVEIIEIDQIDKVANFRLIAVFSDPVAQVNRVLEEFVQFPFVSHHFLIT